MDQQTEHGPYMRGSMQEQFVFYQLHGNMKKGKKATARHSYLHIQSQCATVLSSVDRIELRHHHGLRCPAVTAPPLPPIIHSHHITPRATSKPTREGTIQPHPPLSLPLRWFEPSQSLPGPATSHPLSISLRLSSTGLPPRHWSLHEQTTYIGQHDKPWNARPQSDGAISCLHALAFGDFD